MWRSAVVILTLVGGSLAGPLTSSARLASGSQAARTSGTLPPLFTSHDVLELTLGADFDRLKKDRNEDSEYQSGVLTLAADDGSTRQIEVKVRTRGRFRLKACRFPPLRLNLPKRELRGTVFDGQDRIKLVTHCRGGHGDEQNLLEEYLVYRTYNVITDLSFRVRLARITYVDTSGEDDPTTRYAFFIEEANAIAERVGGMILRLNQVHPEHLSARESARMALFQYMVGNTDWSMVFFHNVELLRTPEKLHVPVPYDFDWAGLVSPAYAKPDASLDIRSVRQRLYRGFCRPEIDFSDLYQEFLSLRPEIERIYHDVEGLGEDEREDALMYLSEFYEIIGSESLARRRIEESCRRT